MYACLAKSERTGGRCGVFLKEPAFCYPHRRKAEKGNLVPLAPAPDLILLQANINKKWTERFESAEVRLAEVNWERREEKRTEQAERLRINPYRYNPIIKFCTGVPVFGPKGLNDVNIQWLWPEFKNAGYRLQNIHLEEKENNIHMNVLVCGFSREENKEVNFSVDAVTLLAEFLNVSFRFLHVFANPPNGDGRIFHSLQVSGREPEKNPFLKLKFNNGLWGTEEVA